MLTRASIKKCWNVLGLGEHIANDGALSTHGSLQIAIGAVTAAAAYALVIVAAWLLPETRARW